MELVFYLFPCAWLQTGLNLSSRWKIRFCISVPIHSFSIFLSPSFQFSYLLHLSLPKRRHRKNVQPPFFDVTRAPSAVQSVNSSASAQVQSRLSGREENIQTFSLLWARTGSMVEMNNLLNRKCLLTALSLFTFQLLNTLGGVPGVSP